MPTPFVTKILHNLARHKFVRSVKGPGGGFHLPEARLSPGGDGRIDRSHTEEDQDEGPEKLRRQRDTELLSASAARALLARQVVRSERRDRSGGKVVSHGLVPRRKEARRLWADTPEINRRFSTSNALESSHTPASEGAHADHNGRTRKADHGEARWNTPGRDPWRREHLLERQPHTVYLPPP